MKGYILKTGSWFSSELYGNNISLGSLSCKGFWRPTFTVNLPENRVIKLRTEKENGITRILSEINEEMISYKLNWKYMGYDVWIKGKHYFFRSNETRGKGYGLEEVKTGSVVLSGTRKLVWSKLKYDVFINMHHEMDDNLNIRFLLLYFHRLIHGIESLHPNMRLLPSLRNRKRLREKRLLY